MGLSLGFYLESRFMVSQTKRHLLFAVALVLFVIGDLWSKSASFALVNRQPCPVAPPYDLYKNPRYLIPYYPVLTTNPGLQFFATYNTGVTFGMLSKYNLRYAFVLFCVIALGILLKLYLEKEPQMVLPKAYFPFRLALLLIASGALGNMYDRIFYIGVRDFISVYLIYDGDRYHYPTFNVADSYIVVGIVIMIFLSFFYAKPVEKKAAPSS